MFARHRKRVTDYFLISNLQEFELSPVARYIRASFASTNGSIVCLLKWDGSFGIGRFYSDGVRYVCREYEVGMSMSDALDKFMTLQNEESVWEKYKG